MSQDIIYTGHQSPSQRGDNVVIVGDTYDFWPNRIGNPRWLPCTTCHFAVRGRDWEIIWETIRGVFSALCVKAYDSSELREPIDLRHGATHRSKLHEVHAFMLPHTAQWYTCPDHVEHTWRQVARVIWLTHGRVDPEMVKYAQNYYGEAPKIA